jgi:membrane fusion protein (multidrug efflux system)
MKHYFYSYLAVVAIFGLASCQSNSASPAAAGTADTSSIPVVQTFPLKATNFATTLDLPGELRPFQTVDLYAKLNSFVKKMYVDVGSEVSQGQLLATLEAPELDAQLQEAASTLHTREALFRASASTYGRLQRTSRIPGTISPNDLENAYAKMSADSSDWLAARSKYLEAQTMTNYLEIRAPFAGVISVRNVYDGAYVGPAGKGSDRPMLTLEQQSKLRLVIAVPEAGVKDLAPADSIHFFVRPLPGRLFTARISRMAGAMNATLRTEQIQMDVENGSRLLLPGMYATVRLELTGTGRTFVVPAAAIASNSQAQFVLRVRDRRVEWVPVQKGRQDIDSVEIYGALTGGDSLVAKATDELRNGVAVLAK